MLGIPPPASPRCASMWLAVYCRQRLDQERTYFAGAASFIRSAALAISFCKVGMSSAM